MLSNEFLFLGALMFSISMISANSIIQKNNKNQKEKEKKLKNLNFEIRRELLNIRNNITNIIRQNDSLKADEILKIKKYSLEQKEEIVKLFQDLFEKEEIILESLENNALELFNYNKDFKQYEHNMNLVSTAKEYRLFVESFYLA
ncbi:MAG TPA: hypothetical protein PK993_01850 [Clostridia bacterium]|nr:hypothetical protein [Clostridia bacterium]